MKRKQREWKNLKNLKILKDSKKWKNLKNCLNWKVWKNPKYLKNSLYRKNSRNSQVFQVWREGWLTSNLRFLILTALVSTETGRKAERAVLALRWIRRDGESRRFPIS